MSELDQQLAEIREAVREGVERIAKVASDLEARGEDGITELLAAHGKVRCRACAGTGAVERLDAGYRKRFGFAPWEGCKACGGDGNDVKGRGYVDVGTAQDPPKVHQRIG